MRLSRRLLELIDTGDRAGVRIFTLKQCLGVGESPSATGWVDWRSARSYHLATAYDMPTGYSGGMDRYCQALVLANTFKHAR